MTRTAAWISAFRLRTLPLALSCILVGSALAFKADKGDYLVFVLALITTIFLQILSNLANDLGDHIHGADNEDRVGPDRAVQSGKISPSQMKKALYVLVVLSLIFGIWLVMEGTRSLPSAYVLGFLALGILAIGAAIKYTYGKNPYGYSGFGDLFVFLFFGITGVVGTYFLHTQSLDPLVLLPAAAIGTFATGVLNINNMRDIENDTQVGKITIASRLGLERAKVYHSILILSACTLAVIHTLLTYSSAIQFIYLITFPLMIAGWLKVLKAKKSALLDPELKKLALSTFAFSLLFSLGLILS